MTTDRAARAGPVLHGIPVIGDAPVKDARYWTEWYLDNWAKWMRLGGKPSGHLNKASGGIVGYMIHTSDTDAACDEADGSAAATTDAVIGDLPPSQQCALHHRYLYAVYRFPRDNFEVVLAQAMLGVTRGLIQKSMWVGA